MFYELLGVSIVAIIIGFAFYYYTWINIIKYIIQQLSFQIVPSSDGSYTVSLTSRDESSF